MKDPIIQEIRQVRHAIEKACQNDPQKYYEHLVRLQKKYAARLVSFKPKSAGKK